MSDPIVKIIRRDGRTTFLEKRPPLTPDEVIQAMRLADIGKMRAALVILSDNDPDLLRLIHNLFTECKRETPR